jgi:alanyl-tRNA synthetase
VDASALADSAAVEAERRELTSLKLDIDESVMSAHVKARLREGLTQRDKQLITVAKKLAKAESDKVADRATAEAEAAAAAGERSVVLELAGGMDSKSMGAIVQKVLKTTAIAVFALSVDDSAGKVACVAAVPDSDVEALAANKWLQAVLADLDGRGGGKPNAAQGSGPAVQNAPKALETAKAFAKSALS